MELEGDPEFVSEWVRLFDMSTNLDIKKKEYIRESFKDIDKVKFLSFYSITKL